MLHSEESQSLKYIFVDFPSAKKKEDAMEGLANGGQGLDQLNDIEKKIIDYIEPVESTSKSGSATEMFEAIDTLSEMVINDPTLVDSSQDEEMKMPDPGLKRAPSKSWNDFGTHSGPSQNHYSSGAQSYSSYGQLGKNRGSGFPRGTYA